MADFYVEVEALVFYRFERLRPRAQPERKRYPESAPAAKHQAQALAVRHQREPKSQRAEPLAQQSLGFASPFELKTCEGSPRERPRPSLSAILDVKPDGDIDTGAGTWKAE
ncbi:MAG: hypothetical protein M3N82_03930 [Pseudomonadota bacterium]|nr:hypothetical protein [Pseudomonadota bacterium]